MIDKNSPQQQELDENIQKSAQQVHDENATVDQFGVSSPPYHTHNGSDSPQVSFNNLTNRNEFLHVFLPGTSAATSGNYGVFFIAPYKCSFMSAYEVHSTAGSDGSAVTLQIEKLIGTTATGSGTNLLASGFNLKGTANTVQTGNLAIAARTIFSLNKGDRLGLSLTGTPTSVAQVVVVVQLMY